MMAGPVSDSKKNLLVRVVSDEKAFAALKPAWENLLAASRSDNIFLSFDWMFHWWKVYREGKELCLIGVEDGSGKFLGLAPLYLRTKVIRGISFRELLFLGSGEAPYPDHLDVIAVSGREQPVAEVVANYLRRGRGKWDVLRVVNTDMEDTCLHLVLEGLRRPAFRAATLEAGRAHLIDLPATWEEYLSGLSRNSRRNLTKRRNRVTREHRVRFYRLEPDRDAREALADLARLHGERMEEKGLGGKFSDPLYFRFHQDLAVDLHAGGRLNLCYLESDGRVVAMRYGFIHRGVLSDYQCGYDPACGDQDVGNVLLGYVIEDAISRKMRVFDFLGGDYQFKESLANRRRATTHIVVINLLGRGLIYYLGLKHKKNSREKARNL